MGEFIKCERSELPKLARRLQRTLDGGSADHPRQCRAPTQPTRRSVHPGPQDVNDETEERLHEREAQKREVAALAPEQPLEAEQQQARDEGDEEEAGDVVATRRGCR